MTILYYLMGSDGRSRKGRVLAVRNGRAVIDEILGESGCYCAIDIPCDHIWSITPMYNQEVLPGVANCVSIEFHERELSDKQKEMLKAVKGSYGIS